jgi:hypothetical protein
MTLQNDNESNVTFHCLMFGICAEGIKAKNRNAVDKFITTNYQQEDDIQKFKETYLQLLKVQDAKKAAIERDLNAEEQELAKNVIARLERDWAEHIGEENISTNMQKNAAFLVEQTLPNQKGVALHFSFV